MLSKHVSIAKNKNVSTCAISREQRLIISQLKVIVDSLGSVSAGNRKRASSRLSIAWQYFGKCQHENIDIEFTEIKNIKT